MQLDFLSVKGRQRAHILDTSEQSYSDRAEEERPPSKLQNVKQMTHAWYAGNIPDVWLLMGGKWKPIFTFHPPLDIQLQVIVFIETFLS